MGKGALTKERPIKTWLVSSRKEGKQGNNIQILRKTGLLFQIKLHPYTKEQMEQIVVPQRYIKAILEDGP